MKCYVALTEPLPDRPVYLTLLEAALKSARQNTSLDLVALYDRAGNTDVTPPALALLRAYDVKVIEQPFSHQESLGKLFTPERQRALFGRVFALPLLAGAFMRLDIPLVETEEDYVLYTDIDVLFLKDIQPADLPVPRVLAAAPEFDRDVSRMTYFNSGVLWLNVTAMRSVSDRIFAMLDRGEPCHTSILDQGYLNQVAFQDTDLLPLRYNWKPYWGINDDAAIVHFHGMKPSGDLAQSGFAMQAESYGTMLNGHIEDLSGMVYYCNRFFEVLGRDGSLWTAHYIADVVKALITLTEREAATRLKDATYPSSKNLKHMLKGYFLRHFSSQR